jgi:hypothetical protein
MFAFTDNDHWVAGIGDPTVAGWVTVAAYFCAALLCWRAARATRVTSAGATEQTRASWFWTAFATVLVLLGFNKQLDLQTWLTLFAKHLAVEEGWYFQRRLLQAAFIGAVAVAGATGLLGMRFLAGRTTGPSRLALAGGIFLGCFILIRASSFHHVDRMLGVNFGGLKVNWILELGSIACIGVAAALAARAGPRLGNSNGNFVWVSAGDRLNKPSL